VKGAFIMHIQQLVLFMSIGFGVIVLFDVLPPRGVKQITVLELKKMLENKEKHNYQYIDVRTAEQFNRLHVFGFKNFPLQELKKDTGTLSKDKKVVVISQRGISGNEACKVLKKQGFTNLANVQGGVITWEPHR